MHTSSETVYYATPYYRVSVDDGVHTVSGRGESNSISNQRRLIEDFVRDKPDILLGEERIDDGFSGVNFERPAFKQMMEDIKTGKTNCIIVKDLSRFGRNYIEAGRYIQKIFPYLGVRFIAVNDHYDSICANDMESGIMIPFRNLINDSYSRDLSVKVRSQFELKRRRGEFIGSFAVYGYQKDPKNRNHLVVDPYAASVVRMIFQWRISGMSNEKIADKLNKQGILSPAEYKRSQGLLYKSGFETGRQAVWNPVSVSRILSNPAYLGHIVQGKRVTPNYKVNKRIEKSPDEWVVVKDMHDAVISQDDFQMVQNLIKMDTRISPGKECVNIFSGIVECGDCKNHMIRKLVSAGKDAEGKLKKYPYYICSANKKDNHFCNSHLISERELEKAVLSALNNYILLQGDLKDVWALLEHVPENEENSLSGDGTFTVKIDEEIIKLRDVSLCLNEDLNEGVIDQEEYAELKQIYMEQIKELEKKRRI